ncbi:hypothetical protein K8352_17710 [Flavobacteriaceae bacterium F89]|uniref:Galactoside O-acetyltransferase n=1 Tax=Cerina litoralis TaxID=2874477 RepID=A0AAE3EYE6_9FLAO|nr:hypothetical protein [Cerina litoralis]MCG2462603.1 hypothetical protein [Cerina litoralis]
MAYYSDTELTAIGFRSIGSNVKISKKASFYDSQQISIGSNVRIDDFCILSGNITLGNYIHISAYSALYGKYEIEMKDFTGLSPRCTVFSATDDFSGEYMISPMVPSELTNVNGGKVLIERFAQVGANTVILPNVVIAEGSAIGAMSLVRFSTKKWGIYAGIPSKFIKRRSQKILELFRSI